MTAIQPDWSNGRIHMAWGNYYSVVPGFLGGDIKKSEAVLSSLKKYHLPLQHMLAAQVALHSAQEELSRGNNKNANAGYKRAKEEIQTAQKSMITTFNDPATGPKVKELYAMSQNLMKEIESMLLNP